MFPAPISRLVGFPAAFFLLLALAGTPPVAACEPVGPDCLTGQWTGALHYRGAGLTIRMTIEDSGQTLTATMDIPDLVMAWEPVAVRRLGSDIRVTLPLDLGSIALAFDGEKLHGSVQLAGQDLTLALAPSDARPLRRQPVVFKTGAINLNGTLVLPDRSPPYPAVVLLHGSGNQGQADWGYRSWADLLARRGLAVLYYDKRGVGDTGGARPADLEQLANDGSHALGYLKSRRDINAARIGLMGSSQGAWLAERIAAARQDIAFLILISAAAGTPRDQDLQQLEYGMRADGLPEDDIEDALAYAGLYFYVARTGQGWPALKTAIRQAADSRWGQYVDQPRSVADLDWWHRNHGLQPASLVASLELPVLLLYGQADWITPPIENAEKLANLFPNPERVQIRVYPRADHRLELKAGKDAAGNWQWPRIAPAVPPDITDWLESHDLN